MNEFSAEISSSELNKELSDADKEALIMQAKDFEELYALLRIFGEIHGGPPANSVYTSEQMIKQIKISRGLHKDTPTFERDIIGVTRTWKLRRKVKELLDQE